MVYRSVPAGEPVVGGEAPLGPPNFGHPTLATLVEEQRSATIVPLASPEITRPGGEMLSGLLIGVPTFWFQIAIPLLLIAWIVPPESAQ